MRRTHGLRSLIWVFAPAIILGVLNAPSFSGESARTVDDLAWMAGHWSATVNGIVMEEAWLEPRGGVMLGVHRDVRPGKSAFFEYLRIEEREDGLVYVASPMGRGSTEFAFSEIDGERAVFENPGHDFPQRIIYSRKNGQLTATAEAMVDGELRSEVWRWRLVE